jgi:hypothetical protein
MVIKKFVVPHLELSMILHSKNKINFRLVHAKKKYNRTFPALKHSIRLSKIMWGRFEAGNYKQPCALLYEKFLYQWSRSCNELTRITNLKFYIDLNPEKTYTQGWPGIGPNINFFFFFLQGTPIYSIQSEMSSAAQQLGSFFTLVHGRITDASYQNKGKWLERNLLFRHNQMHIIFISLGW